MNVALVISARPSYSRVKTLIPALKAKGVTVTPIVVGSALLERYGSVVQTIEADCGPVDKHWTVVEGETHETTVLSAAMVAIKVSETLRRLAPDAVVVHADRHEVLGAAMAARYLELPLIHLQGGEQTGSIDDRVRDAVTQLADVHLVSTERAAARVWLMRGHRAVVTGCPSIDVAAQAILGPPVDLTELGGDGEDIDLSRPFLVVLQHPTSDHADLAYDEMRETLTACQQSGLPSIVFWPGNEAGMDATAKAIRVFRHSMALRSVRNLPPERFLKLLTQAACLVGNSSVGIRECSFLGVPVVNIGDRQAKRERANNVIDVEARAHEIRYSIQTCLMTNVVKRQSTLYGDGHGGERMAEAITEWLRHTSSSWNKANTATVAS